MHPHVRKPLCNRMVRILHRNREWHPVTMISGPPRLVVRDQLANFEIPERPCLLGAATPASDPDHFVEPAPRRESVICGMDCHQPPTVANVRLECGFQ